MTQEDFKSVAYPKEISLYPKLDALCNRNATAKSVHSPALHTHEERWQRLIPYMMNGTRTYLKEKDIKGISRYTFNESSKERNQFFTV
jgi:hypothetical protein